MNRPVKFPWNLENLSVNFPWNLACFHKSPVKFRVSVRELGWSLRPTSMNATYPACDGVVDGWAFTPRHQAALCTPPARLLSTPTEESLLVNHTESTALGESLSSSFSLSDPSRNSSRGIAVADKCSCLSIKLWFFTHSKVPLKDGAISIFLCLQRIA